MIRWFLVILVFTSSSVGAAEYHFSAGGNDVSGNGSANAPWQSVSKMNTILALMVPGDKLLLMRGDVFYGTIDIKQSGTEARPILLGAYGTGKIPVVSGFVAIPGWAQKAKGVFDKTLAPAPGGRLNMVLVNGALQPMGRFPKAGAGDKSYLYIRSHRTSQQVISDDVAALPNFAGAEVVQRKIQWIIDRALVTKHTGNTLTLQPEISPDHPSVTYDNVDGHGFFFQNHINTLTSNGDWSYDPPTKKLSMFFAGANQQRTTVEVATVNTLLTINNKRFISIENLAFRGANQHLVLLNAATNCTFSNCSFEFAGINAIDVERSSVYTTHHNSIINCGFSNINNNAMNLVETTHWKIAGNTIKDIALHQGMGLSGDGQYIGIFKAGSNSLVEYNTIENTGYHGIWFSGDNTMVRYNHVRNFLLVKSDGGGIYAYGKTGNNRQVYRNIVHDGVGNRFGLGEKEHPYSAQVHGIYMDGNTTGVTISENTCYNNNHSGIWLGSNGEITVSGNTLYDNKVAQLKGVDNERPFTKITVVNNLLVARERGSLLVSFNISPQSMAALNMDNNKLGRPLWQPERVRGAKGYSKVPFDWDSYHDGGTVETAQTFYSVDEWKKLSGKDAATQTINPPKGAVMLMRLETNPTRQPMKIVLKGDYSDAYGKLVKGNMTLEPYMSRLLFSPAFSPLAPGRLQLRKQ